MCFNEYKWTENDDRRQKSKIEKLITTSYFLFRHFFKDIWLK